MQKFTIFTILLSISLILVLGDLVLHDYLKNPVIVEVPVEVMVPAESPLLEAPAAEESAAVELAAEPSANLNHLGADMLRSVGFAEPVMKETIFSGLLFQFIAFADQTDALVQQWNTFNGTDYVGTMYEITYPTETSSFEGYLNIRQRAEELSDLGEVNENNLYGGGSIYFNHLVKTKTIHMIMRSGNKVYAFEYAVAHHEKMKNLFDLL
ncbi:hypothetical protein HOH67_01525 [Candidatus Peregrinibacteria bacterium]|jgi:hypothetical protein|nr:hypothetical protein [Candidatus Peregrinibacteria bacterium]MBT5823788.1 hypothetical protein [Candidatus Peregrinibacteria bacterium]